MLFYAIGEKRLSCLEAKKGVDYLCPECQGKVRLRGGPIRQLHFFHVASSPSCRQNGKSKTHLRLQKNLALLIGGEMEVRFSQISRIADVYSSSKKLVIEVQCSSISLEEMQSRNRDYASLGLRVVWVLLAQKFSKQHFFFSHYFTNGQIFYDRFEKRQLPIDFSQEIALPQKMPPLVFGRTISFFGDLTHLALQGQLPIKQRFTSPRFVRFALDFFTQ